MDADNVIESWIFEYFTHKCVKYYYENECNSTKFREDVALAVLTQHLYEGKDSLSRIEYLCMVFLQLLHLEESLAQDDSQTKCDHIGTDDFQKYMTQQIAFASRGSPNDTTKSLARKCLVQTHVVIVKHCLRSRSSDLEKSLKDFGDFVKLMPIDGSEEVYRRCTTLKKVDVGDDFISEYLELIRHLVLTLYSEFDEPYLIKHVQRMNDESNGEEQDPESDVTNDSNTKYTLTQEENDSQSLEESSTEINAGNSLVVSETSSLSTIVSDQNKDSTLMGTSFQKNCTKLPDSNSHSKIEDVPKRTRKSTRILDTDSDIENEVQISRQSSKDLLMEISDDSNGQAGQVKIVSSTNKMFSRPSSEGFETNVSVSKCSGKFWSSSDPDSDSIEQGGAEPQRNVLLEESLPVSETNKQLATGSGSETHSKSTIAPDEDSIEDDYSPDTFSPELKLLLRNTRPSLLADLEEIKLEEGGLVSTIRRRADKFDVQHHMRNAVLLKKKIMRKPPSHRGTRGCHWTGEEEMEFIKETLRIGVGKWVEIKEALQSFRSTVQLKDKWRLFKPWKIDEVRKELGGTALQEWENFERKNYDYASYGNANILVSNFLLIAGGTLFESGLCADIINIPSPLVEYSLVLESLMISAHNQASDLDEVIRVVCVALPALVVLKLI